MSVSFTAAAVQMNAGPEVEENLPVAGDLIRQARDAGAELISLPEVAVSVTTGRTETFKRARLAHEHPAIPFFRDLARETGAILHVGSLTVKLPDEERVANRTYVFAPADGIVATYDKIHMFDVDLDGGESYRESNSSRPGDEAVVVGTRWCPIGLSICYDVRFAYLYRALAQAGAKLIMIPAAFTVPTGTAHWHTLVRARAIETGCYVIAAAQTGTHAQGRKTFGHSLIVDPWGEVLADAGTEPGVITAEIDLDRVASVRGKVPSLTHDRRFKGPAAAARLGAVGD
ncbi:MAG: carbon-nitrogen hydrolase family protein [Azospirillaceae bacterium]